MGQVAKKYCHKIYITDDNPRKENAKKIRKEIMKVLKKSSAIEIGDRKKGLGFDQLITIKPPKKSNHDFDVTFFN